MSITVLTSIVGGKDAPRQKQTKGKADFICFTDKRFQSKLWQVKPAYDRLNDARRNSRAPKILSHQFVDSEYSIWIDGNMSLKKMPEELVKRYLEKHDIAVFKHPIRDCIYGEAKKCAVAGLDDPEIIIEQVNTYEKAGYALHKGLCECGFIIRRNTAKVREFENAWWSEFTRHSNRDQISFMYAVDQVGIRVNMIDMPWRLSNDGLKALRGDVLEMVPHIIANPLVK